MSSQPRTRQRKANDLPVPSGSDDPAERKRVLNVLAQRRYRKRKRDHVKALESRINGQTTAQAEAPSEPLSEKSSMPSMENSPPDGTDPLPETTVTQSLFDGCYSEDWLITPDTADSVQAYSDGFTCPLQEAIYSDLGQMSLDHAAQSQSGINHQSADPMTADLFTHQDLIAAEHSQPDWTTTGSIVNSQALSSSSGPQPSDWTWDPLVFMPCINFASPPAQDSTTTTPDETESTVPTTLTTPSSQPSSTSPSTSPKARTPEPPTLPAHTTALLQTHHLASTTFPDTSALPVADLTLLRAFLSIASLFNLTTTMWSLTATSPFCTPHPPSLPPNLPRNLHPTLLQRSIPHHPLLDLLPWPSTRDKLITVFSAPVHLRPPQARSETALLELVYDIEDGVEGVRVWGESPFEEGNWEVGEKVFRGWWWAFDTEIVRRSNEFRRGRGIRGLKMGSVVGEV